MPPTILTVLQGQIERITYTNDETGYTVAKVKVYGHRDLVIVIGAIVNPPRRGHPDERGMGHHPKYGEQFKIVFCESKTPATVYGPGRVTRGICFRGDRPR
jgi:exodeoxyribonuclease V alpha subunit